MKKLVLSGLLFAGLTFCATAQDAVPMYKPASGNSTLEFQFAPLGGSPLTIGGIKYRTFTSESTALRANIFLGYSNTTDVTLGMDMNGDEIELKDKSSAIDISIAPGFEMHMNGTDRLSPYFGGELSLGFGSSSDKSETYVPFDPTGAVVDEVYTQTTKNGNFTVGVNALAGFDFYVAPHLYIGGEMGFGIEFMSEFDTKTSSDQPGSKDVETPNGGAINVGPNAKGVLRLGFVF